MPHDSYDDDLIRNILTRTKTIAVVGASPDPRRPSYEVLRFLLQRHYRVLAVNPALVAGGARSGQLAGVEAFARLADIAEPIDMVDIFRQSAAAGEIVGEALELPVLPKVIWMQLGVRNDAAAARAEARGVTVIMNRCPVIESGRLMRA